MSFGQLMAFVRTEIGGDVRRNGSIVSALWKRWRPEEVEAMVKGAHALGWTDLRSLNSKDGLGRRWATERYWRDVNGRAPGKLPEGVRAILRRLGE